MRTSLEVADIFRSSGPAYRAVHAGHLSLGQLKVMTAIENCRTAALGGHVEACEDCGHWRVAYNSCLMGRSNNGELATAPPVFSRESSIFTLHNMAPVVPRLLGLGWPIRARTNMLEIYFSASKTLEHLRSGPCGPFLDGFAGALERQGYGSDTAVRYLRAASHVGHVMAGRDASVSDIDLAAFEQHLRTCRCPRAKGGRRNHHIYGARLFRRHLEKIGVCKPAVAAMRPAEPQLVAGFKAWLSKHRGASDATIGLYARDAISFMAALGADPTHWCPADIRCYFMTRASTCGRGTIEKMTTSLRAFLRYVAMQGHCLTGLDNAVPAYAHWQLAEMPRYLSGEQVSRLIAACDGDAGARRRDRAIVLLLARLGLRAGDVAQLRLIDIEWQAGSLRVTGKSRHEVRLPLPQDVGDAVAAYLECRPSFCRSDRVFLSTIAPTRPFLNGDAVSSVVRRIMKRAGLVPPFKGAHVLRHTAATEMLRHGVPLDKIGLVLRHRGIDTTAHYAKADVTLLRQVAQPWPEAL